jgi:hypothetical protein
VTLVNTAAVGVLETARWRGCASGKMRAHTADPKRDIKSRLLRRWGANEVSAISNLNRRAYAKSTSIAIEKGQIFM